MKLLRTTAAATMILMGAGCGTFTDPKPQIDQFTWELLENQSEVTEGVNLVGFFSDISFLGEAKTPTRCYSASSSLQADGANIVIRVNIASSGSGTCGQQAGGVRYSGAIQNLGAGTYTVRVIQTVVGVGTQEFTQQITL